MAFTGQQLVDLARETLNDSAKTRYTDAVLLSFANAALGSLCLLRPDIFVIVGLTVATVASTAEQDLKAHDPRAMRLLWIYRITNGNVVEKCDMDALNRFFPGWMVQSSGDPENWMTHPEDAKQDLGTKYYLSPPPLSGKTLVVKYVQAPAAIALGDNVPAPDPYKDPLAHYIVFRAESKDDEHVIDQRAAQAMSLFMQATGLSKEAKVFMNDGKPQ